MITRLRHDFGGKTFAHELSPVVVVIGRNGSGKTLALHALQVALTGSLEYPLDDKAPARTNQALAELLLPAGCRSGSVTADRKIARHRDGSVSVDVVTGAMKKKAAQEEIDRVAGLDPLAWSLAPWLSLSGPKRAAAMLELAAIRTPLAIETLAFPPEIGRTACRDGVQAAIDDVAAQIRELQRERTEIERRTQADAAELRQHRQPNRPRTEVEASLIAARAQHAQIAAEIKALDLRQQDQALALRGVERLRVELAQAQRQVAQGEGEAKRIRARIEKIEALDYEAPDVDEAAFDLQAAEDGAAGCDLSATVEAGCRALLDRRLLCSDCTAIASKLLAGVEADVAALAVVETARRRLQDAAAALAALEAQRLADTQELALSRARCTSHQAVVNSAEAARARLAGAERDMQRFAPSEHAVELQARAAGLRQQIAADEADQKLLLSSSLIEARQAEAAVKIAALEKSLAPLESARPALADLRLSLLREGLGVLDASADEIYHGATGEHLRFNAERGGVDLVRGDVVTPLESASTGERALAFPAISIALQRARGCTRPTLILDGLESCDRRFDLVTQCARLVKAGALHQAIVNWTARDSVFSAEVSAARAVDGVAVIQLDVQL